MRHHHAFTPDSSIDEPGPRSSGSRSGRGPGRGSRGGRPGPGGGPEGMRRGRGFGRPGGWQQGDLPNADDAQKWFAGRLPDGWFDGVEVTVDREEITVIGTLANVDAETDAAEAEGRISRFRAETREQRISIAREAQARYQRTVSWGARVGDTRALFTHLAVPVMTRLRQPERASSTRSSTPASRALAATRSPGRSSSSASTPTPGCPSCARPWQRSTSSAPRAPRSEPIPHAR